MALNFQDPRLQREKQKILALGPETRAILNTAAATSAFAENDAMRSLRLQSIATERKNKENMLANQQASLNLTKAQQTSQRRAGQRAYNLDKEDFKFAKKQGKRAAILAGLSILPKAYMGYQNYRASGKKVEDILDLAKNIQNSFAK